MQRACDTVGNRCHRTINSIRAGLRASFCSASIAGLAVLWTSANLAAQDSAGDGNAGADGAAVLADPEEFQAAAASEGVASQPSEEPAIAPGDTILEWAFRSLGWSYSLIFLSLSFTLVALFVMNLLTARRENVVPTRLITEFEQQVAEGRFREAYDLSRTDESFLGRVLSSGLAKLSAAGYPQAVEAMQEVGEEESMKLEHRLSYMALIGTISPMIGLFGTVHGMILSFQVIAASTQSPRPAELARGISTALFTTLVGLFIAIPAIAAYNILRNRVARLVLDVGIVSENLIGRVQAAAAKRPAAAKPAGPAPAAPQPAP
jgi:biopolymer transport protein ExbB